MSTTTILATDDDCEYERKPVKRKAPKAKPVRCKQPGCKRDIIPDGYGEWVHADDWMYCCVPNREDVRVAKR